MSMCPFLLQIIWENRFDSSVVGQTCFCSIDGIDFKIEEPTPFSAQWFSHKFRAAGLRYEVGLNIRTGHIVWSFGGYPCGAYTDLKLARESYVFSVNRGEKTLADKIYKDATFFILPNDDNKDIHSRIMSRHETVNKRLRQFNILKNTFRHDISKHPIVFHSVVNLTQLIIQNGQPLFNV